MTTFRWSPNWERDLLATTRVRDALNDAGDIVQRGAEARAPVSDDGSGLNPPGHLKASIHVRPDHSKHHVDVVADADYALYVELGTVPHVIRSHGNYPLRNQKTGQVFGREVQHPGTEAQPFLRPALDDLQGRAL